MKASAKHKYNFLVVDDDIHLHTAFALMLEFNEHEVRTVHTGEAALALLEQEKFDLIITEYWLPGMYGDELAAIVKQQWPHQPIIMATANTEELMFEPPNGVDCVLNKPFSMSQLREAILWVLDRYSGIRPVSPEARRAHGDRPAPSDKQRSSPRAGGTHHL